MEILLCRDLCFEEACSLWVFESTLRVWGKVQGHSASWLGGGAPRFWTQACSLFMNHLEGRSGAGPIASQVASMPQKSKTPGADGTEVDVLLQLVSEDRM